MNPEAHKLVEKLEKLRANTAIEGQVLPTHQSPLMAKLLVLLAEEHEKSAEILEHHTRKLISLTWALVWLTVGLLLFTVCLAIRH